MDSEFDRVPRWGEARDALVRWKAEVIRERRWNARAVSLVLVAICVAVVEDRAYHTVYEAFAVLVAAFATYGYAELVIGTRRDQAHAVFMECIRGFDYGDDLARSASRRLLQDAIDFES